MENGGTENMILKRITTPEFARGISRLKEAAIELFDLRSVLSKHLVQNPNFFLWWVTRLQPQECKLSGPFTFSKWSKNPRPDQLENLGGGDLNNYSAKRI